MHILSYLTSRKIIISYSRLQYPNGYNSYQNIMITKLHMVLYILKYLLFHCVSIYDNFHWLALVSVINRHIFSDL